MLVVCLLAALVAAGCGDDEDSGKGTTLTWFIFNEPSGSPQAAAKKCEQESGGKYNIEFEFLPADADGQREQLVRRLGAEDDSIDLIGMDVIWTGEFANAGWIEPLPEDVAKVVTKDVFPSVVKTGGVRGPALRGAAVVQHRAALVPQRPCPEGRRRRGTR